MKGSIAQLINNVSWLNSGNSEQLFLENEKSENEWSQFYLLFSSLDHVQVEPCEFGSGTLLLMCHEF